VTRAHPRLPAWQRRSLLAAAVLLLLTGIGWLALHYSVGAGAGGLPHPLEAWSMRLHGLAAFGALFLLGALAGAHIPQGWRMSVRHRWAHQRGSGVALCILGGTLAASGWLLYYFAPEPVRPALGWVHAGVGLAMALLAGVHQRRKSRPFLSK
jgi:membrane-associated PAP2 superfamily phosphatase